jgi:PIN domain nuclease of toxin-antitoxin system
MFPDGGGPGYPRCIWYLSDSKQLSPTARLIITTEEKNGESIFVSAISLVEVIYLAERGRLPPTALQSLENALGDPMGSMVIAPLDAAVAKAVQKISRLNVPDMPDRTIAATAVHLNADLVTRDRRLQAAALGNQSIW